MWLKERKITHACYYAGFFTGTDCTGQTGIRRYIFDGRVAHTRNLVTFWEPF